MVLILTTELESKSEFNTILIYHSTAPADVREACFLEAGLGGWGHES